MDLFVEKMATHTSSINQNYKVNTLRMATMCFSDRLVTDRSDYNAKDVTVIEATERKRR